MDSWTFVRVRLDFGGLTNPPKRPREDDSGQSDNRVKSPPKVTSVPAWETRQESDKSDIRYEGSKVSALRFLSVSKWFETSLI